MSMNFNVEKNKEKEVEEVVAEELDTEEYEEIDELVDDNSSSKSNSENTEKKKLIRLLGLLLGVVVVFILIMFLLTSCTGGGTKTYEEIESIMVKAAENYFVDHAESLPKKDGSSQTIDASVLIADGYMKNFSKYGAATCNGIVKVKKIGTNYSYTPKLDCGEAYSSASLAEQIKNDSPLVNSGYGLYNKNGSYVFRGETVNNYVQLDNTVWRVVKITNSNNVVLIKDEPLAMNSPYDNRFNSAANYKSGINNYSSSRIKETLLAEYNKEDSFLSEKDKSKTEQFNLCTGSRGANETGVEQVLECQTLEQNQYVGLLTAADYMNASVDPGCTTAISKNCQNYNYLNGPKTEWWTATPSKTDTYHAYLISINNGMKDTETYNYGGIRPVIYLNAGVLYKSGSGTKLDPYIVK